MMECLMYGAGLRLRVQDLDIGADQIIIRDGKGFKDRVTLLPESVREPLIKTPQRGQGIT